jgi:hypothetical protein
MSMLDQIRVITLRGAKKEHLARCGEFGEPRNKTLCGMVYDPIVRTGSRPVGAKSGKECQTCVNKHEVIRFRLRRYPRSNPEDLKVHLLNRHHAACGQDLPGECTAAIERVTCQKCLLIADAD